MTKQSGPSENGLRPQEELDTAAWQQLTLDVAASQLDREHTAARLGGLLKKRYRCKFEALEQTGMFTAPPT